MKYTILIFILITFGFALFSDAQVIERYVDDDYTMTTVIEKNPDATDMEVLDDLKIGGFGLTETVYIKDYSHEVDVVETLDTDTALEDNYLVASDTYDGLDDLASNQYFEKSNMNPSAKVSVSTTKSVKQINTSTATLDVPRVQKDIPAVAVQVLEEENSRIAVEEVRPERNPIGEKVKRKRRRAPRWNSDRRSKRSTFKCFKF